MNKIIKSLLIVIAFCSCEKNSNMEINVFETSRNGNKLSEKLHRTRKIKAV